MWGTRVSHHLFYICQDTQNMKILKKPSYKDLKYVILSDFRDISVIYRHSECPCIYWKSGEVVHYRNE